MKKQLRGIALILFGILLAIVSVATEPFSAGETYMIWSREFPKVCVNL